MKNHKGFTLIELLVVIVVVAIVVAFAIPAVLRGGVERRKKEFLDAFAVKLPLTVETRNQPLSDEVRRYLTPWVNERLRQLCSPTDAVPSMDPAIVQQVLDDITLRARHCAEAKEVAIREGFLPAETK